MITIYHNPMCSKSRECLLQLEELDIPFATTKYLNEPLTKPELKELVKKLGVKPIELVRQKEPLWIEKFKDTGLTDGKIIDALVKYPELIERPIVVNGNKAVIARPIERINEIL